MLAIQAIKSYYKHTIIIFLLDLKEKSKIRLNYTIALVDC